MTTAFGFCPTCGTPRAAAEQKFCPTCGSALAAAPAAFAVPPVAGPVAPGAPPAWSPPPAVQPTAQAPWTAPQAVSGGAAPLAAPFAPGGTGVVASGVNRPAVGVVAAGALIGLAAFLPWETVLGVGVNGLNVGTGGSIALVLGVLIGLLGLTQLNGRGMGSGSRLLALLGGLAALGLAIIGGAEVNNQASADSGLGYGAIVPVSVGIGVFVVGIGGVIAIAAALVARKRTS